MKSKSRCSHWWRTSQTSIQDETISSTFAVEFLRNDTSKLNSDHDQASNDTAFNV